MPNTNPQPITKNEILLKIKNAKHKSLIDFGIYAGITNDNLEFIQEFASLVPGFKIYLGHSTHSLLLSKTNLTSVFNKLGNISKPVLFHAEDEECLVSNRRKETNLLDHHNIRPISCEVQAIENILNYAPFSSPVHICHVSSRESLKILQSKKNHISFGVTPHHCLLDIENLTQKNESLFKVNPPLRPKHHRQFLYRSLKEGHISILESDHAPHVLEEKMQSFSEAPAGIPGVETMYPIFLALAYQQKISFTQVFSLICEQPAKLFKLRKGSFKNGYHADFIVVDVKRQSKITCKHLHSKSNYTPFEDVSAVFPNHVYVRGEPVIEDSYLVAKPGFGHHVISN